MNRVFFYISILLSFFSYNTIHSQYRDPFSEKRKKISIKKNNHLGLLASKSLFKKQNDSFSNLKGQNGIIGIDHDPFKISGKNKLKPTGIEEDSFTKKQRKLAIINKYNKELVRKKALKSRKKYMKRQME